MEHQQGSLENLGVNLFSAIYHNTNVLVTGHTGFKGSWLSLWLTQMGAKVTGVALPPETQPNHWELLKLNINSHYIDIRDSNALAEVVKNSKPEIVFHLAAQPLVRRSYIDPLATWETNVIGTANLLEACRHTPSIKAIVYDPEAVSNVNWPLGSHANRPKLIASTIL